MADITLRVNIGNLENKDLDGYDDKFENWLRPLLKASDAIVGTVDFVEEDDRTEDEPDEE